MTSSWIAATVDGFSIAGRHIVATAWTDGTMGIHDEGCNMFSYITHNNTHRQVLLFQIKLVKNFMLNDNRFVKKTKFIYTTRKFLNVTIILWINKSVVFCVRVLHIKRRLVLNFK